MRKEVDVDIEDEGRDKGKRFHLTELPAHQAEKWAIRAGLALSHAGVQMPPGMTGWAALAFGALQALNNVAYDELVPLLDEMMSCVKIIPDPKEHPFLMRPLNGQDDVEEIRTILTLRAEVFNLHSGFSLADVRLRWAAAKTSTTTRSTRTSRRRSVQSSAVA